MQRAGRQARSSRGQHLPACSDRMISATISKGRSVRHPRLDVTEDYRYGSGTRCRVPVGFARVPFRLVMGDLDFRSDVDVRPAARFVRPVIGNGRVGLAVLHGSQSPSKLGLAAARRIGNVRLHQRLVPLLRRDRGLPLSQSRGVHSVTQHRNTEAQDDLLSARSLIPGNSVEAMFVPRTSSRSGLLDSRMTYQTAQRSESSGGCIHRARFSHWRFVSAEAFGCGASGKFHAIDASRRAAARASLL